MNDAPHDDGKLLQQFAETGREEPFNELLARHGALVYGVSRRVLGQTQDAEDATQAVFLTLAQKAHALRGYKSVAGWLHQTAWNIARCARKAAQCRKVREEEAGSMLSSGLAGKVAANTASRNGNEWEHIKQLLDLELETLPEKYRVALILHHVEGRTQSDVARLLGVTGGALSRRISRAEELLRQRLVRRGVTLAPALLFPIILQHAAEPMPAALAASTAHAIALTRMGAEPFSPQVTALHKGAMKTMFIQKVTFAASLLLAVLLTGGLAQTVFNGRAHAGAVVASSSSSVAPVAPRGMIGGNENDKAAPVAAPSDAEIAEWIAQLGSENNTERLAAMENLRKAGEKAQAALKIAAEKGAGEAKARAVTLLGVEQTAAALRKIAAASAKIKNYEADVVSMKLAGGIHVDGKGHIKAIPASQLYAMETTITLQGMTIGGRFVLDGKTAWNEMEMPMGKTVMKSKLKPGINQEMSLDVNAFTTTYDFVSARTETVQGRETLVFSGVMRDEARNDDPYADGYAPTAALTAYVDAATLLLNKFETLDDKGVITTASTYSNIKLDGALDAAQFAYVPPADVEVWDTDNPAPAKATPTAMADATRNVENTAAKPADATPSAPVVAGSTAELLQKSAAANKAIANFETDEDNVFMMQGIDFKSKGHIKHITASHRFIVDKSTQMTGMMNIPSHMVCDGTTIYDEESFPETGTQLRKNILKMDLKDRPFDEPSLDANHIKTRNEDRFEFTASREETVDGVKQFVIDGVMRERKAGDKGGNFDRVKGKKLYTMVVDGTDLLLRSIEVTDEKGTLIESTKYTNVKTNVAIDESAFLYSPPAGVKVTDLNDLRKEAPVSKTEKAPTKPADF